MPAPISIVFKRRYKNFHRQNGPIYRCISWRYALLTHILLISFFLLVALQSNPRAEPSGIVGKLCFEFPDEIHISQEGHGISKPKGKSSVALCTSRILVQKRTSYLAIDQSDHSAFASAASLCVDSMKTGKSDSLTSTENVDELDDEVIKIIGHLKAFGYQPIWLDRSSYQHQTGQIEYKFSFTVPGLVDIFSGVFSNRSVATCKAMDMIKAFYDEYSPSLFKTWPEAIQPCQFTFDIDMEWIDLINCFNERKSKILAFVIHSC